MFLTVFNLLESVLWAVLASICIDRAIAMKGRRGRIAAAAGAVLILFALSDVAEATEYGPWWSRWWLFLWKGACVAALAACGWRWNEATRSPAGPEPSPPRDPDRSGS